MTQTFTTGWDIGGAHLKAAVINPDNEIIAVYQQPCPLWKGMEQLRQAALAIIAQLPENSAHVITMTGELVDLFVNRAEGVQQIINAMDAWLPPGRRLVFAGRQGLLELARIDAKHYPDIASSNWLAGASFAAQRIDCGLFVDIGSTTTDILRLDNGNVMTHAYTDYERLISKELVYTGIVRTPVMAVAQSALDEGREIGLMAEYFATMADVYRVTGELNEVHDQADTADGAEKTVTASARRLSRMIGCDFYPEDIARWQRFAENLRGQQLLKIRQACQQVAANRGFSGDPPLIGAGVGRFLVQALAQQLACPYLDFCHLCEGSAATTDISAADCAPAVAVAYLGRAVPAS